jgi:hypothetical protein
MHPLDVCFCFTRSKESKQEGITKPLFGPPETVTTYIMDKKSKDLLFQDKQY